ncbi:restriction endonuclease subunit S [Porphyromonas uenonis]|uniref:restriction endonuclease subunit S n=1 Tax=Porphyromonas uenonis TaxID=281920 RepID=UPI0026ED04AD|nr:restriction endonuclease subunit S [Porphyromonas uenonis]
MKRYDTYTESGISWIGKIPSHWERKRCKELLTESKTVVGDKSNDYTLLSLTTKGVIVRDLSESKGKFPKEFNTYKVVKPDDLVFCLFDVDETPRTVGHVKNYGMLTGAYNVFSVTGVNVRYLYLYFIALDDRKVLKPLYKGLRKVIPLPAFMSMPIYLPPQAEQEAIVAYLDEKCAQIDRYVASLEERIERLGELRQAFITETVTRGINPQAPLRPSGIPWLGEIPKHWERRRCKELLTESKTVVGNKSDDYTLLSLTTNGVIVRDLSESKGKFPKEFDTYKVVKPDDLVFCLFDVDETPRTVGHVKNHGMLTGAYNVFSVTGVNIRYLYLYFIALDDRKALKPLYKGLRKVIPLPAFMSMPIYLPPQAEQEAIVAYLDKKTTQIDRYTGQLEEMIRQMKDLRQTIISEAVTGKICVLPN